MEDNNQENLSGRFTYKLKVSKTATFEEMQDAFREATGDHELVLDQKVYQDFVALNEIDEERKSTILKIIGKFGDVYKNKYDRESMKKKEEINDLANYIYDRNLDITLESVGESPDFIVKYKNEQYGIEHTGIFDSEVVAQINNIEEILKDVSILIKERDPDFKWLINITFHPNKIFLRDREKLAESWANYILSLAKRIEMEKPLDISKIIISKHPELQIVLSEEYLLKELTDESIEKLIVGKEKKIEKYKENSETSKIWLLIVLAGASAKSNLNVNLDILPKRDTPFDKIIIYNSLKRTIIETLK
jgi:hypothetical protein